MNINHYYYMFVHAGHNGIELPSLRRTFATLSLRAGMNVIQLQGLLSHSSLEMTRHYVEMLDEDLVQTHREHGPIETIFNSQCLIHLFGLLK